MKKRQRFTPTKIANWSKQGRGTGTQSDYEPWHQVTRGDPASRGRSHLSQWAYSPRSHHFLSDGESDVFGFITMLPNIVDIREQMPLNTNHHAHELAAYDIRHLHKIVPGTIACAEEMSIKHPVVSSNGVVAAWIMTTDFLVTLETDPGIYELLAISVKIDETLLSSRDRKLLRLEQFYWSCQGVQWLLISPSVYAKAISNTVRMAFPWGLPKRNEDVISSANLKFCAEHVAMLEGTSLTNVLISIRDHLNVSLDFAQRSFWQAVWAGLIKLDLHRSVWPSEPIQLLMESDFWQQNPVAARRSICI